MFSNPCHSFCLKNVEKLAGKETHWVKCLLCKLEDLGLHPQHPHQSHA